MYKKVTSGMVGQLNFESEVEDTEKKPEPKQAQVNSQSEDDPF